MQRLCDQKTRRRTNRTESVSSRIIPGGFGPCERLVIYTGRRSSMRSRRGSVHTGRIRRFCAVAATAKDCLGGSGRSARSAFAPWFRRLPRRSVGVPRAAGAPGADRLGPDSPRSPAGFTLRARQRRLYKVESVGRVAGSSRDERGSGVASSGLPPCNSYKWRARADGHV